MSKHFENRDSTCKTDVESLAAYRNRLPHITDKIIESCRDKDCFNHVDYEKIPSRDAVIKIIDNFLEIIFPGYFNTEKLDPTNLKFIMGQSITRLFNGLAEQVTNSFRHECFRFDLDCKDCLAKGHEVSLDILESIPRLRKILATDVRATFEGDPSSRSYDEIIFSFPGIYAITVYRVAHNLFESGVPLLPRIMTEHAHSKTGIDIHPAAEIGESFAIDHGTGIVIGETTTIGKNVRIYQGVTLGALSLPRDAGEQLRGKKRHPTIEDNVIIYSGSTILGGDTVIGTGSVVGGNIWITESVPPNSRVIMEKPRLVYK